MPQNFVQGSSSIKSTKMRVKQERNFGLRPPLREVIFVFYSYIFLTHFGLSFFVALKNSTGVQGRGNDLLSLKTVDHYPDMRVF